MSVNFEGAGFPFQATTATPTPVDGQVVRASVDTSDGGLRVHVQNGSSGGTSATDNSTFTAGSSSGTPEMGAFDDSATVLASGKLAIQRITGYRAGHVNMRNNSGTEVGTLAAAFRIDPTGATPQPVTQSGTWSPGIFGLGRTTLPTSVASAAQVQVLLDRYGRTYSIAPVLTVTSSAGTAITTATNTSLIAAPSAGNHLRIHRLWAQNSSATGTWCYWGNGSGVKTLPFFLAQNQPFSMAVNGEWELSTATALFMNTATTGANVEWFVAHETLAD
tara:strand:- start:2028 stop:2855 length:828 start_codon:yes stop_codon:yes gene_type:complete